MAIKLYVIDKPMPTENEIANNEIPIEVGTLKLTRNYNKIIDMGYFETIPIKEDAELNEVLKEGSHIFFDKELGSRSDFIIDKVKKVYISVKNGVRKFSYKVDIIDKSIIYHKIVLPNRSLTQRVVGNLKETRDEMLNYLDLYFNNYDGENISLDSGVSEANIPLYAQEFKWLQPTLYEVLDDLIGKNYKLKLYSEIGGSEYKLFLSDLLIPKTEMNHSTITNVEINNTLDNSPKAITSMVENASGFLMIEDNIPQTADIGIMVDEDEKTRYDTTFRINRVKKAIIKGNLDAIGSSGLLIPSGHEDGYIEMDITEYIQTREIWETLPIRVSSFFISDEFTADAIDFRNCNIYYEVGKKGIERIFEPYKDYTLSWGLEDFSLTTIMNHVWFHNRDKIIKSSIWPVDYKPDDEDEWFDEWEEGSWEEQLIGLVRFFNKDAEKMILDIEYEVVDNFRYDTAKEKGFGTTIKNQTEGYINFNLYTEHQKDTIRKLGNDEIIVMGSVASKENLPQLAETYYYTNIIAQITEVYKKNSIDYMAIITSKNNRIDDDMSINNRRRYFQIVNEQDSIERFEFFETKVLTIGGVEYINLARLQTYDENNVLIKEGLIRLLNKQTPYEKLFYGKTLDNKYLGRKLVEKQEGNKKFTMLEGVFYTDEQTGEFHKMVITLGEGNTNYQDGFPENVNEFIPKSIPFEIYHKDVGERIAFGVRYYTEEAPSKELLFEVITEFDIEYAIGRALRLELEEEILITEWNVDFYRSKDIGSSFDLEVITDFDVEYGVGKDLRLSQDFLSYVLFDVEYGRSKDLMLNVDFNNSVGFDVEYIRSKNIGFNVDFEAKLDIGVSVTVNKPITSKPTILGVSCKTFVIIATVYTIYAEIKNNSSNKVDIYNDNNEFLGIINGNKTKQISIYVSETPPSSTFSVSVKAVEEGKGMSNTSTYTKYGLICSF